MAIKVSGVVVVDDNKNVTANTISIEHELYAYAANGASGYAGVPGQVLQVYDATPPPVPMTNTGGSSSNVGGWTTNGATGYVYTADHADFKPGTGDFTCEAFFNFQSDVTYARLFSKGNYTEAGNFAVEFSGGNSFLIHINGSFQIYTTSASVTLNTWHHIAITRQSGSVRVWLDGVPTTAQTQAGTINNTGTFCIGSQSAANGFPDAWISNVRYIRSAFYTTAFTPSTSELTAVTNTKLLLLGDNGTSSTIVDSSTAAHTMVNVGVTQSSIYGPTIPSSAPHSYYAKWDNNPPPALDSQCSLLIGAAPVLGSHTYSIGIGKCSLGTGACGLNNIALGTSSLRNIASGARNIAFGYNSMCNTTMGFENFAAGPQSLISNTTGIRNIAMGTYSMLNNTVGSYNIALGLNSLASSTCSDNTVAIGMGALQYGDFTCTIAIKAGSTSICADSTGLKVNGTVVGGASLDAYCSFKVNNSTYSLGFSNIAIGKDALKNPYPFPWGATGIIALGEQALRNNSTGTDNIAIGRQALKYNTSGNSNIAQGYQTLASNTYGYNNIAIGGGASAMNVTGSRNIAIGSTALLGNITGSNNVAIGDGALNFGNYYNTIGIVAGPTRLYVNSTGLKVNGSVVGGLNAQSSFKANASSYSLGYYNIAIGKNALCRPPTYPWYAQCNIAIGNRALMCNNFGNTNLALGLGALTYNTTGNLNIAIGAFAMSNGTTSCRSIAIGAGALIFGNYYDTIALKAGYSCIFVNGSGMQVNGADVPALNNCGSFKANKSICSLGYYNIAIGRDALSHPITYPWGAKGNIALGLSALQCTTYGRHNNAQGFAALLHNTYGSYNIAIGCGAMIFNTTGSHNISLGAYSMRANLGSYNIALGRQSLKGNIGIHNIGQGGYTLANNCGNHNIAQGFQALYFNSYACHNIAQGAYALFSNTTGGCNIAQGHRAMLNASSGSYNIAQGNCALLQNSTGSHNIAQGNKALAGNSSGSCNIALGNCALYRNCGSNNIAMGQYTMSYNRSGSYNIAQGACALKNNLYGNNNIAQGNSALMLNSYGNNNIAQGYRALFSNSTGSNNIAQGPNALFLNTTGNYNLAIGYKAGSCNGTGNNNTFLGNCAFGIAATCSNTITLGNSAITAIRAQVTSITALSDERDKTDIETLPIGLEFIRQVRPVKFTWNMRDGGKVGIKEAGFIAQELKQIVDIYNVNDYLELVISNEDESRYEATPGKLIPVMVKAIQELATLNDALTLRVVELENKLSNKG